MPKNDDIIGEIDEVNAKLKIAPPWPPPSRQFEQRCSVCGKMDLFGIVTEDRGSIGISKHVER